MYTGLAMRQERSVRENSIREILNAKKGYAIVRNNKGKKVGLQGKRIEIRKKRRIPEGTIESLLPVIQRTLIDFPEILPPKQGFWGELKENAPYTEEEAVNLLRRHGNSVEETTAEVINRVLKLSGKNPASLDEGVIQTFFNLLEEEVYTLYIKTTETTFRGKK